MAASIISKCVKELSKSLRKGAGDAVRRELELTGRYIVAKKIPMHEGEALMILRGFAGSRVENPALYEMLGTKLGKMLPFLTSAQVTQCVLNLTLAGNTSWSRPKAHYTDHVLSSLQDMPPQELYALAWCYKQCSCTSTRELLFNGTSLKDPRWVSQELALVKLLSTADRNQLPARLLQELQDWPQIKDEQSVRASAKELFVPLFTLISKQKDKLPPAFASRVMDILVQESCLSSLSQQSALAVLECAGRSQTLTSLQLVTLLTIVLSNPKSVRNALRAVSAASHADKTILRHAMLPTVSNQFLYWLTEAVEKKPAQQKRAEHVLFLLATGKVDMSTCSKQLLRCAHVVQGNAYAGALWCMANGTAALTEDTKDACLQIAAAFLALPEQERQYNGRVLWSLGKMGVVPVNLMSYIPATPTPNELDLALQGMLHLGQNAIVHKMLLTHTELLPAVFPSTLCRVLRLATCRVRRIVTELLDKRKRQLDAEDLAHIVTSGDAGQQHMTELFNKSYVSPIAVTVLAEGLLRMQGTEEHPLLTHNVKRHLLNYKHPERLAGTCKAAAWILYMLSEQGNGVYTVKNSKLWSASLKRLTFPWPEEDSTVIAATLAPLILSSKVSHRVLHERTAGVYNKLHPATLRLPFEQRVRLLVAAAFFKVKDGELEKTVVKQADTAGRVLLLLNTCLFSETLARMGIEWVRDAGKGRLNTTEWDIISILARKGTHGNTGVEKLLQRRARGEDCLDALEVLLANYAKFSDIVEEVETWPDALHGKCTLNRLLPVLGKLPAVPRESPALPRLITFIRGLLTTTLQGGKNAVNMEALLRLVKDVDNANVTKCVPGAAVDRYVLYEEVPGTLQKTCLKVEGIKGLTRRLLR
eukprot:TRINITY_DN12017_c0_g2_i1.p1 TRINITY_DN12017_c0_g2~~TRINITY_DN12017_c0_g2_i1.p1  ORF type:complete len:873 (+),score=147.77 TRINITY_DN12017_c0_g2_i1:128-2746(+)